MTGDSTLLRQLKLPQHGFSKADVTHIGELWLMLLEDYAMTWLATVVMQSQTDETS